MVGSTVDTSLVMKIENKNFNIKLWPLSHLLVIKTNLNIPVHGNTKKGTPDIMHRIHILLTSSIELKLVDIKQQKY